MFVRYLALASATSIGLTAQISVAPIDDSLKPNGYRSYSPLENTTIEYLSRLRQITVAVEWVITRTGIFLGPDTFGQFNTIKSRQEAESWLVSRLTPLLTSPSALGA